MRYFDAIVIGAGQAGPPLTARLTAAGMSVALIERHLFGGTCVNTGCTPTKTLVASAECAHRARHAADYGVQAGSVAVELSAVMARKNQVVENSRRGVEQWLRSMPRCSVYTGHACFTAAHEVRVDSETLSAPRIFINVGGRALLPEMPGVRDVPVLTNTSILELQELPEHLVVVGGSYVGLEFGQMFRRFGSQVTVVEKASRLVSREDADISAGIRAILEGEGIQVRTGAECIRFSRRAGRIAVGVECQEGEPEVLGSHVLLAVGRRPNTHDLGSAAAGLALDARGYIQVDEELQTNVPGIWALGDCNGRGAFTHTAYNDFEIVADNLLTGAHRRVSDRITCYALYVDPPLGRAGVTETEARATGKKLLVGKRPMTRVSRAIEKGETQGFMKILVDAQSEQIVGAAILGTGGDEVVHAVLDTMAARSSYKTLQRTVHIHPTVAELLPTILGELQPLEATAAAP